MGIKLWTLVYKSVVSHGELLSSCSNTGTHIGEGSDIATNGKNLLVSKPFHVGKALKLETPRK